MNEWNLAERALDYLGRADKIPHRTEGESAILEEIDPNSKRILDVGSGNGRLLDLCLMKCRGASGVALDFSETMLEKLREKYEGGDRVTVVEHDLNDPLTFEFESFDIVVSSFAIHHVDDIRKYKLYKEIWQILQKDGIFCNLEHVSSPT
jgi:tRNA (cmo5U34)-methyltransferase